MSNINSIWANQKPTGGTINKTRIEYIEHFYCFAATNHITGQHLYIMSVSENLEIPELKNYRFKGVEIYTLHIESEKRIELYIYLLDNDLKAIFSLFIQNILDDVKISITEKEALKLTLKVISKWKKLFDKINFNGLTIDEQKGLIGELLFLNYLMKDKSLKDSSVDYWTSSEREFQAKDFTMGSIGFEIKFTSANQPRIKISSEKQLDIENFAELFLVLYSAEAVKENGVSLNSLIQQIRQNISSEEIRDSFNGKLQLIGYFDEDREHYITMYSIKNVFVFLVNNDFPKITKRDLKLGIYDVSYSIEISAVENLMIEFDQIHLNV